MRRNCIGDFGNTQTIELGVQGTISKKIKNQRIFRDSSSWKVLRFY